MMIKSKDTESKKLHSVSSNNNKVGKKKKNQRQRNKGRNKKLKLKHKKEALNKSNDKVSHSSVEELKIKSKKPKNKKIVKDKDNLKPLNNAKKLSNPLENESINKKRKLSYVDNLHGEDNNEPAAKKKKCKKKNKKSKANSVKTTNEKMSVIKFPKSPEEYSANWKDFQAKILTKVDNKNTKKKLPLPVNKKSEKVPKNDFVTDEKTIEKPKIDIQETKEIWFDNVDPILLEQATQDTKDDEAILKPHTDSQGNTRELVKSNTFEGVTNLIAMDCEMVGVGFDGKDSILARISLVNHFGHLLYDVYVKPTEKVTDYRTAVSGIRPEDIVEGVEFSEVQENVCRLINNRILIGHALKNDLKILFLSHPKRKIRDTSKFKPFKKLFGGRTPSLKKLSEKLLGVKIQSGEHSSIQDAQAAMRLYTLYRKEWEDIIGPSHKTKKKKKANSEKQLKETIIQALKDSSDESDD